MRFTKSSFLLLCTLLTVVGVRANSQATVVENQTTTIYLDAQKGLDVASGTSVSPLKSIQSAINKANANNQKKIGTKIVINPGMYRELVNIGRISAQTTVPLTVEAATTGTVIISGSDVLSNWTQVPANHSIYEDNWAYNLRQTALPSGWPAGFPGIALRTEMVFVNNIPLTQVMAYGSLRAGTFFVNEAANFIYVWPVAGTNMQTALVEAAVRPQTLNVSRRSNVVIRGLVLRHAASKVNTTGANVSNSSNVLIDSVQAIWNNWGGLGVFSSSNVTVKNSIASYNGGVGFLGNKDQTTLFDFNESDYNNWRGAQAAFYEWAMGGTKLFAMRSTTVQNHYSYNNQAEGLWFDTNNKNITINNATLVGNVTAALQIERNEGPVTLENSHLCTSGVGVNLLTSRNVTIKNNTFYNNGGTNKFQAEIYLAGQHNGIKIKDWQTGETYDLFTTGTVLTGNVFQDASDGQNVFGTYVSGADWTDFANSLNASNNKWYSSVSATPFKIVNGKSVNLKGWQSAVGTDYSSDWAPAPSSPAAACAVPTTTYKDFNVIVNSGKYTMAAGKAVATVHVNSFGFGAVTLSATGMPSGVTASISNGSLTSGVATLTLSASKTAARQTVPITLWATGSNRVHSVTFNVVIVPAA
jgi:hypothetical protein